MDNSVKKILITGATGFLGSNLLKKLLADNYEVIVAKRSVSNTYRIKDVLSRVKTFDLDSDNVERIFQEQEIDIILHCATDYGRKSVPDLQIIEANLILPLKLLQFGRKYVVRCFINTDTILDKRVNHYSLSKKQFKDWLKTYQESMVCVNMALEHFYGPGDDKTKFVSWIFDELIKEVPSIPLTRGEQKRDFIYIDDVVDAFMLVLKNVLNWERGFYNYEIGTNDLMTIKELAQSVKKILGNEKTVLDFGALPYRENEMMESEADTAAVRLLGWQPRYDIMSGLIKMVTEEKKIRNLNF